MPAQFTGLSSIYELESMAVTWPPQTSEEAFELKLIWQRNSAFNNASNLSNQRHTGG